jgi:hypothetical protein
MTVKVDTSKLIGVRLSRKRFGNTKAFNASEKDQVATTFHGDRKRFRGSKVLISAKDPTLKKINAVMSGLSNWLTAYTQPYHVEGIRLATVDMIEKVNQQVAAHQKELGALKTEMNFRRGTIMEDAQQEMGDAYDPGLFPPGFADAWDISVEFPSIMPDERLKELDPALYQSEVNRVLAEMQASANEAIGVLLGETAAMVDRMVDILTGGEDGKPRRFTKSTFETWETLFDRFGKITAVMSGESKDKAEAIVTAAQRLLDGVTPEKVRKNTDGCVTEMKQGFATLQESLAGMTELMPERVLVLDDPDEQENAA